MEKKIYVSEKNKAHLRKVFGCSTMMVWKALNFKSDSELARKIRYTALTQLNGTPNWKQADVETTHEEAEQTMTQIFGERVKLVYDRNDGSTSILVDGKVTRKEQDLSIPAFMKLQSEVEIMAMSL
ncbi:hypothetical protein KZY66_07650 [Prevotella salivae]|jgi:hypothetical protein|uniref:Uncharacterized protein n=1 Tax=Myoviridae sp. ctLEM34 TaxID=2825082 RepID=A0A8S5TR24_9CAUD|nr:hypothetical protein [Segatella salivae]MBF1547911.1 hypothetical protein [Segatella salivae]MBW4907158.1 hypothetical protein [Segatella salivae]DAF84660.1 MAG TPA: hypothetical protein [Myoviridae sp. ctLEM34]DAX26632.1 MAG TPA: hypothetical protein [Caudoviricetes sp.]